MCSAQAQQHSQSARSLVLVADLDHTLVQNEDSTHRRLLALNHVWTACFADDPRGVRGGNALVYSTGRSPALFEELWRDTPMLTPDVLSCSVGTELLYNTRSLVGKALLRGTASGARLVHLRSIAVIASRSPQAPGARLLSLAGTAEDADDAPIAPWASFAVDSAWRRELDRGGWSRTRIKEAVAATCGQELTPQVRRDSACARSSRFAKVPPPGGRITQGSMPVPHRPHRSKGRTS